MNPRVDDAVGVDLDEVVVEDFVIVDDVVLEGKAVAVPTGAILHSSAPAKLSGAARVIFANC